MVLLSVFTYIAVAVLLVVAGVPLAVVVGLMLGGACVFLVAVRRKEERLLANGTPTRGRVSKVMWGRGSARVDYSYEAGSAELSNTLWITTGLVWSRFGLDPEAGDDLLVVYDPSVPSDSTIWSLGPIALQSKRASKRYLGLPRQLMVLGVIVLVTVGLPLGFRLWNSFPPEPIVGCANSNRSPSLSLTLQDGRRVSLQLGTHRGPASCPTLGALLEKRRWERDYRLNGDPVGDTDWRGVPQLLPLGAIIAIVVGAGLRFRWRRQKT